MKTLKKSHIALIIVSVLFLCGSIGMTVYLLCSNYQNVRLFKQAQSNFQRGDTESLQLAGEQLLRLIRYDNDNESAYIMLGEIAEKQKKYPEQVYYCYMAHRLNPLSKENKKRYVKSLCFARYFDRLENFLSQEQELREEFDGISLYAAGQNGNINKYKAKYQPQKPFYELAFQLFKFREDAADKKLEALKKIPAKDAFLKQELLAAETELYLAKQEIDNAEKALEEAYKLNEFAFAPVLGRFYAKYRTFGKALLVFEKYLTSYHDTAIAMRTAEIYCLLNQTDKIAELRSKFQNDTGNAAMLTCYYLDALTALAKNDMVSLKDSVLPLRKTINTPLALFMFFCVDLQENNLAEIQSGYAALLAMQDYLDLQKRADDMISGYLKHSLANIKGKEELYLPLAVQLYSRKPEAFTAKLILLAQRKSNSVNVTILNDALKRFGNDHGLIKIAIEYFLNQNLSESERLIADYKRLFPGKKRDMLRYEIFLLLKKQDFNRASALFKGNFSKEILPEYWTFASSTMREDDLLFLSKDSLYEPFCRTLLLMKKGDKKKACDLLEKADAKGNLALLFFAAKTLAENGRNQAALQKYAQFPEKSPYQLAVLLNTSELFAENGDLIKALDLSHRAYHLNPDMPETQLCHGDKLFKSGNLNKIPDIVKLSSTSPYRRQLEKLWIAGMQSRLKSFDIHKQQEKIREQCRQLLVIDPDNHTALELMKKLNKMPQ